MVSIFLWILAVVPSLALLHFALEIVCGLRAIGKHAQATVPVTVAVVIPAHNEACLIADTVSGLGEDAVRVLVTADNCTDDTATLAEAAGAEVIHRFDMERRGKGFALAFAKDHLAPDPPAAVVVLDADCRISRGSVNELASYCTALGAPVQAVNLLRAPAQATPLVRLSNFAFLVKNLVRARGLYRLGGGIPLYGTGMAFPWRIFSKLELATPDAVEDLRLAIELASQGVRVHLCEQVEVVSDSAELRDSLDQRARWEHGFLRTAARHGLAMVGRGLGRASRHQLAFGAHLLVPPFALLMLWATVALLLLGAIGLGIGEILPAAVLAGSLTLAILAVALAWVFEGRRVLDLRTLGMAPLYVVWKIPMYVRALTARHTHWNRTRRINEQP